jgi:hypothetical protein
MAKPKRPSKTRLHDHNYKELAGQLRGKKDSVVTLSWTLYHTTGTRRLTTLP